MRILLTGGGTGGHVYPALAIKEGLSALSPDTQFLYVGTQRGIESRIVPETGMDFLTLKVEGFNKKISPRTLVNFFNLLGSFLGAWRILKKFDPEVIIGTGGYVSFPVVFVAGLKKKRIYLHEQNAYPGVANRFLSRFAHRIFLSYPESLQYFKLPRERMVILGNPVREDFGKMDQELKKQSLGLEGKRVVLAFGGSGGAAAINRLTLAIAAAFEEKPEIFFILGAGRRYYEAMAEKGRVYKNLKVMAYIDPMPDYMGASDLVLARSGAITLAEIAAMGLPAVLVPSPHVANDHQMKNALAFESAGAALVVDEGDFNVDQVVAQVEALLGSDEILKKMGGCAVNLHHPNSAKLIAEEILREI